MAWSDDDYIVAFDAEAGDIASLATSAQKIIWFNEGQARLLIRKASYIDVTWAAGDRQIQLPADFVKMDKLVENDAASMEPWREWGSYLTLDDPNGATGAGTARLYYWAEFAPMTTSTTLTELTNSQDYACLYYALHRFYKKLASNRAYYKRYATLVAQNAVSMTDLQQESDRYLQDFLDARADLEPTPPAFFFQD